MTADERIAALEARLAAVEARLAALEARPVTIPAPSPAVIQYTRCQYCGLPFSQCAGHTICGRV